MIKYNKIEIRHHKKSRTRKRGKKSSTKQWKETKP